MSTAISTTAANALCSKSLPFKYSSLFDVVDYIIGFIAQMSNVALGCLMIYFEGEM